MANLRADSVLNALSLCARPIRTHPNTVCVLLYDFPQARCQLSTWGLMWSHYFSKEFWRMSWDVWLIIERFEVSFSISMINVKHLTFDWRLATPTHQPEPKICFTNIQNWYKIVVFLLVSSSYLLHVLKRVLQTNPLGCISPQAWPPNMLSEIRLKGHMSQ